MREHLSLAELERFDPRAPRNKVERRFCCPLCGGNKTISPEHRSVAANVNTGQWMCHRCQQSGLLKEYWKEQPQNLPYRAQVQQRKQAVLRQFFAVSPTPVKQPTHHSKEEQQKVDRIRSRYEEWVKAFPGSPAEKYMITRGIPRELALATGCGYAASWGHWEQQGGEWNMVGADRRVIFPVHDRDGNLVSISARAIDSNYFGAKVVSRGQKKMGVFNGCGGLKADIVIITEAPIDSLSLSLAGYPSIAMIGTSWPDWLWLRCSFRTVGIATDADEAGDEAAKKLTKMLAPLGSRCVRLRPDGGKDWNEVLVKAGVEALISQVSTLLCPSKNNKG